MKESDLMTTKEIAAYCGISEWSVRKEIKAGRLKVRKTGDGYKTLRTIVEEFREDFYRGGQNGQDESKGPKDT